MLKLHNVPILTCLDLYAHFDAGEVLRQPQEFLTFARGHLRFHPANELCIELFALAASGEKLMRCHGEMGFFQGRMPPDTLSEIKPVIDETYIYYKSTGLPDWERRFIMSAAASILACAPFKKPDASDDSAASVLSLREASILLAPGKAYTCAAASEADFAAGAELHVVELIAKEGYSSGAVLTLDDGHSLSIPSGARRYVTACGDGVMSILPDTVICGDELMQRDAEKGCITVNGERTCIPVNASSFASLGEGRYLWLDGEQLYMAGMNMDEIPYRLRRPSARYVELCVRDGSLWLLTTRGIVKGVEGTPAHLQACYFSLEAALGGNEHGRK